jgi:hypothetical protein
LVAQRRAVSATVVRMLTSRNAAFAATLLVLLVNTGCSKLGSNTSDGTTSGTGSKIDANLTGLPTYPNLTTATMNGHPPAQGGLYDSHTNDSYEQVTTWYRAHLPGAKEEKNRYIDGVNGQKATTFYTTKFNGQVAIATKTGEPGTGIALGEDAH